ncbi:MAG TPA: LysR family transcriptional regulator [Rhodanobacteraceae bacterium]
MNVTLRQLRTFLTVGEARHFRRAAERLHLTQPAVSRHVAELEGELGVALFDRNTRGVHLTAVGARLQPALTRVLDELDALLAETRVEGEGFHGTVRVASGPTPSAELVPGCLARCARAYPELTMLSRDRVQSEVIDAVRAGEVDFGIAIDPADQSGLVVETVLYDSFIWVGYRGHPLARLRRVPWRRLEGERLVLLDRSSGSRRLIDAALAGYGITVRVVQETGHTHTAFRMVEAGLGTTVTPGLSAPLSPGLVVRPLTPRVQRAITLVRRDGRSLSPAAARVWDVLAAVARDRGARGRTAA